MNAVQNAVQRLIEARKKDHPDWSFGDIARRAGVTRQTVQQWAAGTHVPAPDKVAALAKGLDLPDYVVQQAISEANGFAPIQVVSVEDDPQVAMLVATQQRLSEVDKRRLQRVAESLLNDEDGETSPN